MLFLAGQGDLQPVQPLPVGDHTDVLALGFEDRPLLDVQLEEGVHLARADFFLTDPADPLELVAELQPRRVLAIVGPVLRMQAREHARGQHGRRKPRTFLVGPVGDHDRVLGLDAQIIERPHDFQPREHAQNPVVLAACRLGIEVRAHVNRQRVRVRARAGGEHVAHGVHAHGAAGFLAPPLKQMAAFAVFVRQGLAVVAAGDAGADLRHLHQAVPQPGCIGFQVIAGSTHRTLHFRRSAVGGQRAAGLLGWVVQSAACAATVWPVRSSMAPAGRRSMVMH